MCLENLASSVTNVTLRWNCYKQALVSSVTHRALSPCKSVTEVHGADSHDTASAKV